MLLQRRGDALWLIRQHDHGWLSGLMAHHWHGISASERLSHDLCAAVALHDLPWQRHDVAPVLHENTGEPVDFLSLSLSKRLQLYQRGLDELALIHPRVALLVSMHYAAFKGLRGVEDFQEHESLRQHRIKAALGLVESDEASLARELFFIQMFDLLSLYVCLTAPGVEDSGRPPWLLPHDMATTPDGEKISLRWDPEEPPTLICDPMPFDRPLEVTLPVVVLPRSSFDSADELAHAWADATGHGHWNVRIVGQSKV